MVVSGESQPKPLAVTWSDLIDELAATVILFVSIIAAMSVKVISEKETAYIYLFLYLELRPPASDAHQRHKKPPKGMRKYRHH